MSRFERVKQWTAFSRTWHIYDAKWQNPFHSAKVTTELFFSFIHFPFSFFCRFPSPHYLQISVLYYSDPSPLSLLFVDFVFLLFLDLSSHYSQVSFLSWKINFFYLLKVFFLKYLQIFYLSLLADFFPHIILLFLPLSSFSCYHYSQIFLPSIIRCFLFISWM